MLRHHSSGPSNYSHGVGRVLSETQYYPFGRPRLKEGIDRNGNSYLYTSKELELPNEKAMSFSEKLQNYREFVYETGVLPSKKDKSLDE